MWLGVLWAWSPQRASTQAVVFSKVYSTSYEGLYLVTLPTSNRRHGGWFSKLGRERAEGEIRDTSHALPLPSLPNSPEVQAVGGVAGGPEGRPGALE